MESCDKSKIIYKVVDKEKFKTYLRSLKRTNEEMAEDIGVEPTTISAWKNGKPNIRSYNIEQIILHYKPDNLAKIGVQKCNLAEEKQKYAEVFQNRLKVLMDENNIKNKELAKLVNIDESTVSKWCNGKQFPEIYQLIRIAEIFNVTFDYLLMSTRKGVKYEDLKLNVDTVDKLRKYQIERNLLFAINHKTIEDITEMDIVNFVIANTDFFKNLKAKVQEYYIEHIENNKKLLESLSNAEECYQKHRKDKCNPFLIDYDKNNVLERKKDFKEHQDKLKNIREEFYEEFKELMTDITNYTEENIMDIFDKVFENIPKILENKNNVEK